MVPLVGPRKFVVLTPWEFQDLPVHARVDVLDELLKVNMQLQPDLLNRVQRGEGFWALKAMVFGVTARIAGVGLAVGDGETVCVGLDVGDGVAVSDGEVVDDGVVMDDGVAVGDGPVIVT